MTENEERIWLAKINTCTSTEELHAMLTGMAEQGINPTGDMVIAANEKKIELLRRMR
jgi:hypothetical protein